MWFRQIALAVSALFSAHLVSAAEPRPAGDFTRRADALLRAHLAQGDFSGVVLVARHGRPLLRRGYGLADRQWGAPATPDTVFRIGSTTKQFTAAAVMQLAEVGKIKLDEQIGTYVDDIPPAWSAATIRELLNHSAGVPNYTEVNGFIRGPSRLDLTPPQLIALVRDKPLDFAPGSRFNYSNTDYALLGMVIERVSGQPYANFVRDHILHPLGLNHTAYDEPGDVVPHRAAGYWIVDGTVKNARMMTTADAYAGGDFARPPMICCTGTRRSMAES